jgi:hypothetical protein
VPLKRSEFSSYLGATAQMQSFNPQRTCMNIAERLRFKDRGSPEERL